MTLKSKYRTVFAKIVNFNRNLKRFSDRLHTEAVIGEQLCAPFFQKNIIQNNKAKSIKREKKLFDLIRRSAYFSVLLVYLLMALISLLS